MVMVELWLFLGLGFVLGEQERLKHGWSGPVKGFPREVWAAKGPGL